MAAKIVLDVCTPEGKTWLAEVTGLDPKFGFQRSFVNPISRDTSRSGKTGTHTYLVDDGLYEANEGRRRLGKSYYRVTDDEATRISQDELIAALTCATTAGE